MSRRSALAVGTATLAAAAVTFVGCSDHSSSDVAGASSSTAPADPFWEVIARQARLDDRSLTPSAAARELGVARTELAGLADVTPERVEELAARSRADFAASRTVDVSGWVLSRTDVLVAVVAAGDRS